MSEHLPLLSTVGLQLQEIAYILMCALERRESYGQDTPEYKGCTFAIEALRSVHAIARNAYVLISQHAH